MADQKPFTDEEVAHYKAIAESHIPEFIDGNLKANWVEGALNMAYYLTKQNPSHPLPPSSDKELFQWVKASERLPDINDCGQGIIVRYKGHKYSAHYHQDNNQFDVSHARQTITFTKNRYEEIEWLSPVQPKEELRSAQEIKGIKEILEENNIYEGQFHNCDYAAIFESVKQYHAQFESSQQTGEGIPDEDIKREVQHIFDSGANEIRVMGLITRLLKRQYATPPPSDLPVRFAKWISVEESPKKSGEYLCYDENYCKSYPYNVYRYNDYNGQWYNGADGVHPTHYMDLPSPPSK